MTIETVVCWSCSHKVLTEEVQEADGVCPVCHAPIDFDEGENDD